MAPGDAQLREGPLIAMALIKDTDAPDKKKRH
jgi:hypothetical protein